MNQKSSKRMKYFKQNFIDLPKNDLTFSNLLFSNYFSTIFTFFMIELTKIITIEILINLIKKFENSMTLLNSILYFNQIFILLFNYHLNFHLKIHSKIIKKITFDFLLSFLYSDLCFNF